ncbi:MAG: exonuclease domain-containing protein [Treponema sp.]
MSDYNFAYFYDKSAEFPGKRKGKSLVGFPADYCVIDLETTGCEPWADAIIEVAAIKVVNNEVVDVFSSLIRPQKGGKYCCVDSFVTELTGITNEMLDKAPSSKATLATFKSFVGNFIVVGHNVNFDVSFLYHNYEDYFRNDFIDTVRLARFLLPDLPSRTLANLAQYFKIDVTVAHRALDDCKTTKECYDALKDTMLQAYGSAENFIDTRIKKKHQKQQRLTQQLHAKDITPEKTDFDEDSPLFGMHCVFTGTLAKMTRAEAMQIVADYGGINQDTLTKKTNFLILGSQNYNVVKDGKSGKHKKAEDLILKGADLKILSEDAFYYMIGGEKHGNDQRISPSAQKSKPFIEDNPVKQQPKGLLSRARGIINGWK